MGIWDKMFGSKVTEKDHTDAPLQQEFTQLKDKYQAVLSVIEQQGIQLSNLHTENGKLVIIGNAPTQEAANRVWDQIKLYPNSAQEMLVDIKAPAAEKSQAAAATVQNTTETLRTYTIKPGDTLSKIASQFYGNANQYMKIVEANRDKIKDPDKIFPGEQIYIP